MKQNENTFELSNATFFYATAPLRFSFECFALKYSSLFASQIIALFLEQMFPEEQGIAEFLGALLLSFMLLPVVCIIAAIQALPICVLELSVGLLTLAPAMAIAITAVPVVCLIALFESMCDFISSFDNDYVVTQEFEFNS
ncbi:hypothetical protein [Legionella shakespearei]|uniref:Uncharacterized protein n=1 Tax=Legionella shakespearei DSM 23087 TaxID=1122169 RepID=A0A0W0ZE23_9GAMM|nr:hypothetical protein [Legionella shakespearei]KTD67564.1 hypothetical protein Lsha_0005 [Legionella shakespearei DSM 23087]